MTVLLDARPHAAAIKAAVTVTVGADRVYDYGKVPGSDGNAGTLPAIYVVMSVERRYNPVLRTPGRAGAAGWRATFRSVGRTVDETRWAQFQVTRALNENRLLVDGEHTSRFQLETPGSPEPDDGRYSALDVYTYVHQ